MKSFISKTFLHKKLSGFKSYRKWIGGVWKHNTISFSSSKSFGWHFTLTDGEPYFDYINRGTEYYLSKTLSYSELCPGKLYKIVAGYYNPVIVNLNREIISNFKFNEPITFIEYVEKDIDILDEDVDEELRHELMSLQYKFLLGNGSVGFLQLYHPFFDPYKFIPV